MSHDRDLQDESAELVEDPPAPIPFDVVGEVARFLPWGAEEFRQLAFVDETFLNGIASATFLWDYDRPGPLISKWWAPNDPLLLRAARYEPQRPIHLDVRGVEAVDCWEGLLDELSGHEGLQLLLHGIEDSDVPLLSPLLPGVQVVGLSDQRNLTDGGIATLSTLAHGILSLNLSGCTRLTDSSVHHLCAGMGQMEYLDLSSTRITDEGVKQLAGLPSLRSIKMNGCDALTGRGFAELDNLPLLETVSLAGCQRLSDRVLGQLNQLQHLRHLFLSDTRVTGRFLELCGGLQQQLLTLDLAHCNSITDETVAFIAERFVALETLSLRRSNIRGGCLPSIAAMKHLVSLDLSGCVWITERELMALDALAPVSSGAVAVRLSDMAMIRPESLATLRDRLPPHVSIVV